MNSSERMNIGIVGAARRGGSFRAGIEANGACIHAVCDIQADKIRECAEAMGAAECYTDCEEMLEKSDLDAVVIGTPMPFHAEQSIMALERGLHVLCEVTAAVSLEECRRLVAAAEASSAIYMMAENYTYMKPNQIVKELVRQGLFGTPYYAEGEYIHELKHMNEYQTPWRRRWQTGVDGITYGTHSLGPILQWMPGDRVTKVCCEAAGVHHIDHTGQPYCQACSTMLCKMASGGLVKIRVDMVSDRPHNMVNYQLQGTDGCYESGRAPGEKNRIWLRDRSPDMHTWTDLNELVDEFLPDFWKEGMERAKTAGHGGGDYFEILDFIDAVTGRRECPIGIHEAMDMTLPGLISQQSIAEQGRWIEVPDSRAW
ncbi:MAG: Gfo/Idh/MocA family oxidoreductase [Candidatus Pacebacteria bacterium]|nr:Gfo/Idh/MocA family oxidoreductase [Candidatus Paceibacterota bacterium]